MFIRALPPTLLLAPLCALIGHPALANGQTTTITSSQKVPMEITVTSGAQGTTADELVQPALQLSGDDLKQAQRGSLGATLEQQPGISSSDFGTGAGRPVIRGQAGARVEVLENGVSSMDLSALSPDHAVTISPFQARQIEVIQGPASLLYGNGAFGGVINVENNRLVREINEGFHGEITGSAGTVANEHLLAADLNQGRGNQQWHADVTSSDASDYRIPGNANSDGASGSQGRLANSGNRVNAGALAWNRIDARGDSLGIALSQHEARYGLPISAAGYIDMAQTRLDTQLVLQHPLNGLETLQVRAGGSAYQHTEFEDAVTLGTRFRDNEQQLRVDAVHLPYAGFRGAFGLQLAHRDLQALGEEAYVPPTQSLQGALFLVESRDTGFGRLEAGARVEDKRYRVDGALANRQFMPLSAALGLTTNAGTGRQVKLTLSHAERAPAAEELYAMGPHGATATWERGHADARPERSDDIELGFTQQRGRLDLTLNIFHKEARDYLYQRTVDTGRNADGSAASGGAGANQADGHPDRVTADGSYNPAGDYLLTDYRQGRVRFNGYEAVANLALLRDGPVQLDLRAFTDALRGTVVGDGPLPRLNPARQGLALRAQQGRLRGNLSWTHVQGQNRIANDQETRSNGYERLDAELNWRLPLTPRAGGESVLFLRGSNLLNADIRRATSFIKDYAPAPGRGLSLGFRVSF